MKRQKTTKTAKQNKMYVFSVTLPYLIFLVKICVNYSEESKYI